MAAPEAVLQARARSAYERGRLRAALPLTATSVPMVALALLATGRLAATLAGGALLAALLAAASWRGQDFARGARTGLLAGLGPYLLPLATRCTAHLCVDGVCLLYPAVCISGGVLAGLAVVFLARRAVPRAPSAAYVGAALAVAGLAGSLGCVMAGAVGVFGMAGGLAVGATPLLLRPLAADR
jgi:hypothetical protein